MKLSNDGMTPIYVQIASWLETEIMSGSIKDDEKIYSQYQLAEMFNINPATAAKGLNILADENIVYKKRGLGMFVTANAKEQIRLKRKDQIMKKMVFELIVEARHLGVTEDELVVMVKQAMKKYKEEEKE